MSNFRTSRKLAGFGNSIFAEMTRLANEHGAVNLSQGFPDFSGPKLVVDEVKAALDEGHHQYARSMGHPLLVEAIAKSRSDHFGITLDPMTEVIVTSGGTECLTSAILGLVEPGDEVVLIEPFYDSYPAAVAMAGGVSKYLTLEAPDFRLRAKDLDQVISDRTKLLILNNPHNPTGRVFDADELSEVARRAEQRNFIVLSDEVYEQIHFTGARFQPFSTLPGMRDRTLTVSSAGKSYSFTGWKVGWATGPAPLIAAVQAAHQFVTFSTSTPFQVGLARAMAKLPADYYVELRREYEARRDLMLEILVDSGFEPSVPKGTYFVMADFSRLYSEDDQTVARRMVREVGVAAIPPSSFYAARPDQARKLLRFAFPKKKETLEEAGRRLRHRSRT